MHAITVCMVRNLQTGNSSLQLHLLYDEYFETVRAGEDQEPPVWSELITFQSLNSAYDDEEYVPNLSGGWLDPAALEARRHQGSHRHPNIPVQEEEWTHYLGEKYLRHRPIQHQPP